METLAQPILNGVLLGGLYALIAIGMSMMFGIVKLVNLAHGDLMIMASYVGLVLTAWLGINPFWTIIFAIPIMFFVGYFIQGFLLNRVLGKEMEPPLLVAFGVSVILQNLLLMIFTPDARSLPMPLSTMSIKGNGIFEYFGIVFDQLLRVSAGNIPALPVYPEILSGPQHPSSVG